MFFAHNERECECERDDDDACGQGTALPQQQILFYPEDREIQKRAYKKKIHTYNNGEGGARSRGERDPHVHLHALQSSSIAPAGGRVRKRSACPFSIHPPCVPSTHLTLAISVVGYPPSFSPPPPLPAHSSRLFLSLTLWGIHEHG